MTMVRLVALADGDFSLAKHISDISISEHCWKKNGYFKYFVYI